MNKCKTCRYRSTRANDYFHLSGTQHYRCERIPMLEGVLDWNADYSGRTLDSDSLAFAVDGSGYRADVIVSEEFGCTMWEPVE